LKTGKPVVLGFIYRSSISIGTGKRNSSSYFETWFAGSEAGSAIADVLFEMKNPSGKLTPCPKKCW
jgi:beta-glucosidase